MTKAVYKREYLTGQLLTVSELGHDPHGREQGSGQAGMALVESLHLNSKEAEKEGYWAMGELLKPGNQPLLLYSTWLYLPMLPKYSTN